MSGGFFRGTSADQDTRFSNKQAKLLKSQKFASELEHTVDMTKVKLDVIRPWIANRVTELLGFEDEVIINFIFGLLDGKDVDGKQIQIQLTGFMEKNTRKFMKELWSLLLSAQKNISGVPQQFLAAKEEEAKKTAEADRISREIQQKREKENRESEREIKRKLGDENDDSRVVSHASDASSKHLLPNASNAHVKDNEVGRHKLQGQERFTKSPVEDRSPSLHRNSSSSPRPRSRSFSNTRSFSRSRSSERFRSRSISKSPRRQRRSPLIEKRSHSPVRSSRYRRSPQNTWSPSRRRSPYLRRRSPSPIRRRSPTPVQRRSLSPQYRKSPSFVRRRSPSPRWRSSYVRRRSPRVRRRLPSPSRHRSPSPPRRRSPRYHRRSPAPSYRSRDVKVSPYKRSRSRSPYPSQSPPHGGHTLRSLSKEPGKHDHASDRYRHEDEGHGPRGRRSPDVRSLEGEDKHSGGGQKAESSARPLSTSLRSPQRDVMPQPEEPYRGQYKSPVYARKTNVNEDGSEQDQHGTRRRHVERQEIGDASKKANQHSHMVHDGSESLQATEFREHSPAALGANSTPGSEDHLELSKSMKKSHSPRRYDGFSQDDYSNKPSRLSSHISEDIEYEPGRPEGDTSQDHALVRQSSLRRHTGDDLSPEKALNGGNMTSKRGHRTKIDDDDYSLDYKRPVVKRSIKNVEHTRRVDTYESDDEENENSRHHSSDSKKQKKETIERKHKGHDDSDALSQDDERKEAKRRRKEEKKMQKEEKRRRHEKRHRRREDQRAIKMKGRSDDADSREKSQKYGDISDGDEGHEISHRSNAEEPELAQRNLEIELRKKALESLRAKKAISH